MSTFKASEFMNTSHKEANDTKFDPIPEPDEKGWGGQVSKLEPRSVKGKDGEERHVLDVTWTILDEAVKTLTGLAAPSVRQTIWLDITKEGNLDFSKGKNVQLGKLREALNQNRAGKAWKPSDMMGQVAKLITKQRIDKDDPELVYSDVKKVFAA